MITSISNQSILVASYGETEFAEKTQIKVKKPSLYKVLLINDDYTPMDFVVMVLMQIFGKSEAEACDIMLTVHNKGKAVCGVYTYEVAETKVMQVHEMGASQQHPLQCVMEKE